MTIASLLSPLLSITHFSSTYTHPQDALTALPELTEKI